MANLDLTEMERQLLLDVLQNVSHKGDITAFLSHVSGHSRDNFNLVCDNIKHKLKTP